MLRRDVKYASSGLSSSSSVESEKSEGGSSGGNSAEADMPWGGWEGAGCCLTSAGRWRLYCSWKCCVKLEREKFSEDGQIRWNGWWGR